MDATKLSQLKGLFPQFDYDVLEGILHASSSSVDDAVDILLSMEKGHHNPDDPDLHVGEKVVKAEPRPVQRTATARRRQRQLRKRARPGLKHQQRIKWVRFDPFVTSIKKEPLKDEEENTFAPLAALNEEEDVESWEQRAETEKEGAPALSLFDPKLYSSDLFSSADFPPLDPVARDQPQVEPSLSFTEKEADSEEEPCYDEFIETEADDAFITSTTSYEEDPEPEPVKTLISVKLYLPDSIIRRVSIVRTDPETYEKLGTNFEAGSSFKYLDDEKEWITIRSQEELEECLRVHEESIWPDQSATTPILKLYVQ